MVSDYGGPPCGIRGCACTHTYPCDRGWISLAPVQKNGQFYESTTVCPTCRPDASDRYADSLRRSSTDDLGPYVKPPIPPAPRRDHAPLIPLPPWFRDAVAASTEAAAAVRARYAPGIAIPPEEMDAATLAAVEAVKERYTR